MAVTRKDLGQVVPIKGTDYYTDAEKAQLEAEISADFATQIAAKEDSSNKVTSISNESTNTQYPSAKLLYDQLTSKQAEIDALRNAVPDATTEITDFICIEDSSNLPLKELDIFGNAIQATTSIAGGDEYDSPTPDHPQNIHIVTRR